MTSARRSFRTTGLNRSSWALFGTVGILLLVFFSPSLASTIQARTGSFPISAVGPTQTRSVTLDPASLPGSVDSDTSFQVSFVERGLASGSSWNVNLSGREWIGGAWAINTSGTTETSTELSLQFSLPNGSYNYSVGPVTTSAFPEPPDGWFNVSGSSVSLSITFRNFTDVPPSQQSTSGQTVNFTETGLPSGTSWDVYLSGRTWTGSEWAINTSGTERTAAGPTIAFTLPNGTYNYSVGPTSKSAFPEPPDGWFNVSGVALEISVAFRNFSSPPPPGIFIHLYPVWFNESGLPVGTNWSVTLAWFPSSTLENTSAIASMTSSIRFVLPNGTYQYSIGSVAGYAATPRNGTLNISGQATGVPVGSHAIGVNFVPSPTRTITPPNTPNGGGVGGWALGLSLAAVSLIAFGIGLISYRAVARERERGRALAIRLFGTVWQSDSDGWPQPANRP